jgi:hypothetical protein
MKTIRFATHNDGKKRCGKCGAWKTLWFFPRDRSRPDGRWHTCRACNRADWKQRGKFLAADKKAREKALHPSRTGLVGLRQYRRKNGGEFASLPPELRRPARQLLNRYFARHRHHLTGPRIAALCACAASNVQRLGDRSWARRLWRIKGYYRSQRRSLEAQAQREPIPTRRARRGFTNLTGI